MEQTVFKKMAKQILALLVGALLLRSDNIKECNIVGESNFT